MLLTNKQLEILRVISEGNPDGTDVDLDELLERINYTTSKQSMQFSIRALIGRELIEKAPAPSLRRGRLRTVFSLTHMGKHYSAVYAKSPISGVLEDDEDDLGVLGESLI